MHRLLFRSKQVLKFVATRNSYSLTGLKKDFGSEIIINGEDNSLYNVSDIGFDRILSNTDLIEIARYEHYFILPNHKDLKMISENVPKASSTFVKTKAFEILDGIQVLLTQSELPKKLYEVIKIVNLKLQLIYPDYINESKNDVNSSVAYQFLTDVISNTSTNAAYIDVSLQLGLFDRAFKYMKKIRMEDKQPSGVTQRSLIVDSVFYEPAAHLLAKKGNVSAITNLLSEMKSACISPSVIMIFSCLEAVGRKEVIDTSVVQQMIAFIHEKDISLKEAFIIAPISKFSYPYIIKAINSVDSEFKFESVNQVNKNRNKDLKNTPLNSTIADLNRQFDDQLELEKKGNLIVNSSFKEVFEEDLIAKVSEIELEWKNHLLLGLKKSQNLLFGSDRSRLYPFVTALSDQTYVDVMLGVLHRCMNDRTFQFTHINNIYSTIGDIVENHYHYRYLKKEKYFPQLKLIFGKFFNKLEKKPQDVNLDKLWQEAIVENVSQGNLQSRSVPWDRKLKIRIGRFLYEIMYENLNVTFRDTNGVETKTPVLYEELIEEADGGFTVARVQWKVASMFKLTSKASLGFTALDLPMLHPPVPVYCNYNTGYFHLSNYATRLVRKSSEIELYDEDLLQTGNITKIYNALNVLAMCSWTIEKENLDLVTNIFNNKGSLKLKIPIRSEQMEVPQRPDDYLSDYKGYSQFKKVFANHKKDKMEMYALRLTLFYKINIAQKFRDKQFWFPYSMDFRSRVYPCPPHLNHIGDDTTRGLLKFSTGKKLGPKGLDWLKIHLINIYGLHKKASNADRLKAANDNMSEIIDSVLRPLDGRKWWQESEKPWQTLSACREIFLAMKFSDEKGNGLSDDFISHLGVQQDGSCNGLQHYAALGRDAEGARAVNLIKMDTPQDVYSDVLKYVEIKLKVDAENGVAEAKDLNGFVNRKVIKQTVMTTVYGVTQFGAKEQIQKQLKELEGLPIEKLTKCSIYLSKIVLNSIGEIFCSATKIQNWFVELASSVAKYREANISWQTPLDLIVTQPYFQDKSKKVLKPDSRRNKNAFPPNFIHSLDSTHMMMTALKCWQQNVTFVSVHDCYWTHACDVDSMNKICREQFVELYRKPILENLSEYLYQKYGFHNEKGQILTKNQLKFNALCKNIPKKGSYNIEDVLKSTYFFS